MDSNILSKKYSDLMELASNKKDEYASAKPFPFILLDDFFNPEYLSQVLGDFPDLSKSDYTHEFKTGSRNEEKKFVSTSPEIFTKKINHFFNFLHSHIFLDFLKELAGVKEYLIPDPYFWGSGLHETKKDGFLKIHADFNVHPLLKLYRRINVITYLNKNWKDEWGGHVELWNKDVSKCIHKVLPIFNRVVIFSTSTFTMHGHPLPLTCPNNNSRKSLICYFYTNGRPKSEIDKKLPAHNTLYFNRKDSEDNVDKTMVEFKKIFGKFYVRKKSNTLY
jgi:hypothetical protein